jgi:EpsD family peptidyl-prolyl cis-trans isomerase
LALGACHLGNLGKAAAPTGQVVATVNGEEITLTQLRQEMGNATSTDPKAQKAAEQAALQSIVVRKVLSKAAHDQGLDKTPDYVVRKQKTEELLLVQSLEAKVAAEVPTPTKEEAQSYMNNHPDTFANRKVFTVDQIRFATPADQKQLAGLQPLNTMDEIVNYLNGLHIQFERGQANLDAVGSDPRVVDAILKLPPNEVFVLPGNGMVLVNQLKQTNVVPFTGDTATNFAIATIKAQRTRDVVGSSMAQYMKKAGANISYNAAYRPPPPPKAAKPPASSAAAQPPASSAPNT